MYKQHWSPVRCSARQLHRRSLRIREHVRFDEANRKRATPSKRGRDSAASPTTYWSGPMGTPKRRAFRSALLGNSRTECQPDATAILPSSAVATAVGVVCENRLAAEYVRETLAPRWAASVCSLPTVPAGFQVVVVDVGNPVNLAMAYLLTGQSSVLAIDQQRSLDDLAMLLAHGIRGFVSHDDVRRFLPEALERVVSGGLWWPTQVLAAAAERGHEHHSHRRDVLRSFTNAEEEIIQLLTRGRLSNKEIATIAGITERTVRFHLANIFEKCGVHDRHSLLEAIGGTKHELRTSGTPDTSLDETQLSRRSTIGSTDAARRIGPQAAVTATRTRMAAAAASVGPSVGVSPNNTERKPLAQTRPIHPPATTASSESNARRRATR